MKNTRKLLAVVLVIFMTFSLAPAMALAHEAPEETLQEAPTDIQLEVPQEAEEDIPQETEALPQAEPEPEITEVQAVEAQEPAAQPAIAPLDISRTSISFDYSGGWRFTLVGSGNATPIGDNSADNPVVIMQSDPGTPTTKTISINGAGSGTNLLYIELQGVNIKPSSDVSPLSISGGGNVDIRLSGTNTLDATYGYGAGLQVEEEDPYGSAILNIVNIRAKNGPGDKLIAKSEFGAGIGGNGGSAGVMGGTCGKVIVHSGTIEATSTVGAGIGGGSGNPSNAGAGGTVTISGGDVTAKSIDSAGIGGGGSWGGFCGIGAKVTISNGTVRAISQNGAGIGGGSGFGKGNGDTLLITGGNVTATSTNGAGIGGGAGVDGAHSAGDGGMVTITGGFVSATSTNGAGIGGGMGGSIGEMNLTRRNATDYYINGVMADGNSKLYFWFTDSNGAARKISLMAGGKTYTGSVATDDGGGVATMTEYNPTPPPPITYEVRFKYMDGTTEDKTVPLARGGKLLEPEPPTRQSYVFEGWFTDDKYTAKYDFSKAVYENTTLYAKWLPKVQNLRAVHPGYSVTDRLTLVWDAFENAEEYIIRSGEGVEVARTTDTKRLMTGLETAKKYSYTVTSVVNGEEGVRSDMLVTATRPSAPEGFKYNKKTVRSVRVQWNAAAGVNYYRLYRKIDGKFKHIETVKGQTEYTFTGLAPNSKNYFKIVPVVRVNGASLRGVSADAKAQTLGG